MTLTVDANVVVKWFVAEALSDDARLLLAPRIHLHAPDVLLVEYANAIWKKVHRNEISDPQPYFDELANLPEIVALHPAGDLLDRAAQIAVEADQPVYDCLYQACAETTASALITADQRFAGKAAGSGVDVWRIGADGTADRVEAAANAPVIHRKTVDELIAAYEVFAATHRRVVEAPGDRTDADTDLHLHSPAYRRLADRVNDLTDDERVDLLAIGWLGDGRLDADWKRNLEHAHKMIRRLDHHYAAGYGRHWRVGYERLTRWMQTHGPAAVDS